MTEQSELLACKWTEKHFFFPLFFILVFGINHCSPNSHFHPGGILVNNHAETKHPDILWAVTVPQNPFSTYITALRALSLFTLWA